MRFCVEKGNLFLWGNHTRHDDAENYCLFTNLHSLLTPHTLCMWNGGRGGIFRNMTQVCVIRLSRIIRFETT